MLSPPGDRAEVCGLEGGSAVGPQRGTAGPRRHRSRATGQALKAASPEVRGAILPGAHGTSSSLLVLAAARWGGGGSAVLAGWSRDDPALRSPRGWKSFLQLGTARLWSPSRCPGESPRPLARPRSYAESPPSGDQQARHRTLGLSQRWVQTPASSTCRCWEPSCRAVAQG